MFLKRLMNLKIHALQFARTGGGCATTIWPSACTTTITLRKVNINFVMGSLGRDGENIL